LELARASPLSGCAFIYDSFDRILEAFLDGQLCRTKNRWRKNAARPALFALALMAGAASARAQEPPYFVTYSHAMEEPGNLEIEFKGTQAAPKNDNAFGGATVEFEYGAKAWWTTEVYLSGQTTARSSRASGGRTVSGRC
jgi:hypothetical protein